MINFAFKMSYDKQNLTQDNFILNLLNWPKALLINFICIDHSCKILFIGLIFDTYLPIVIVLLGKTYLVRILTLASKFIIKSTFNDPLKCIRNQI